MVSRTVVQRVNGLLRVVRVLLLLAIPLPLWLLRSPSPVDLSTNAATPALVSAPTPTAARELSWYAPLWERNFKAELIPQPTAPSAPTAPPANVPALFATFVERGVAYAHLRGQDGTLRMHELGESVDDFRLAAIEQGRVQLQRGDQSYWIVVPQESHP